MTKRRASVVAGLAVLLIGFTSLPAVAQFASSIEGTVTDASGAIVPGATITVLNEETGTEQSVTTTSAGYYRVPALPAALFTLRATLSGFKTVVQEHIRLQVAETKTINVTLEAGQVQEEVTVSATAPLVETSEGRVSSVIEESQVKDLPLLGRNFFNLVVLTPGVTGRAAGGGQAYAQSNADIFINEYGVNMNANGARTESNNFLVDSSTVSSSQRSGVANITPNPEVVEEVRVAVNNFSAETGRNGSVLVNILTKSGSNTWHGSTSLFYTNDSLQSKNEFQQQVPNFQHPDFGRKEYSWGLGGPILKDRTFFFTSGDVLRSEVAISRAARIVTPQFIDFMTQNRPEQRLDVRDEHVPGVVQRRAELPDRRPAARLVVLGWRRHRLAGRRNPVQSAGDRRGHIQHHVAAQGPAVDRAHRSSPQRQQGSDLRRDQPHDGRQGVVRHAGCLPGLQHHLANQQPALQHELDADRLAAHGERGVVLVRARLR